MFPDNQNDQLIFLTHDAEKSETEALMILTNVF
jgi:hypothetical protein